MLPIDRMKAIAKQILPPVITNAVQRARGVPQPRLPALVKARPYPRSKEAGIVAQARQHLGQATSVLAIDRMPGPSRRWKAYFDRIRTDINWLTTVSDVIRYGQRRIGFDHREAAVDQLTFFQLYENTLKSEFPHFRDQIDEMGDSPYSCAETLAESRGRLISNIFFIHLRYVLLCLSYVERPRIVAEIGGGYGGPARLWLDNPIHRPTVYVIIDFPESLFFAEAFLRANFDELKLLYVTDPAPLNRDVALQYAVILCPVGCVDALSSVALDLVVNTGSMQEMTEEWIDFWMEWLRRQECHYFYSLNYFAQPLDNMAEGANTWSPRLASQWVVRLQAFNPPLVRQQSVRNYAEILAAKPAVEPSISPDGLLARYDLTRHRVLDGQLLLEAMDIVRTYPDEHIMWDLLVRCVSEMRPVAKEAFYLAEYLAKHGSTAFHEHSGGELQKLRSELRRLRQSGREDFDSVFTGI